MKSLILSFIVLAGSTAMANDVNLNGYGSDFVPEYYSWCDQNKVISQDQKGDLVVVADCSEQGLTCEAVQLYRAKRLAIVASCKAK